MIKVERNTLPELKGTEKQVAWANQIRENRLEKLEDYFNSVQCNKENAQRFLNVIAENEVYASAWIDVKSFDAKAMIRHFNEKLARFGNKK